MLQLLLTVNNLKQSLIHWISHLFTSHVFLSEYHFKCGCLSAVVAVWGVSKAPASVHQTPFQTNTSNFTLVSVYLNLKELLVKIKKTKQLNGKHWQIYSKPITKGRQSISFNDWFLYNSVSMFGNLMNTSVNNYYYHMKHQTISLLCWVAWDDYEW